MRVLRTYAIATLSVTVALLLTLGIPPVREHFKFLLFLVAVLVSATDGLWPGVFATLLSMVLADYFLLPPLYSLAIFGQGDLVPDLLFCGAGFAITWTTHRLQRSEEAARAAAAVIESSADSIVRTSLDNTIVSWNKSAERAFGYPAEEAIGHPISLIVPADCMEGLLGLTERVHHGASFQNHETVLVRKDGKRINVALTLSPVQDRTRRIIGMSTIARDITEHKLAEKALRESVEKLRLLAQMGNLLQASSTPADAYAVAARFAQALIPGATGALYAYSTPTKDLAVVSSWGDWQSVEQESLAPEECWGLRMGRAYFVEDTRSKLFCRHLHHPPPTCYLCAPLTARGETIGLLHLQWSQHRQAASGEAPPERVEYPWPATSIAEHLALAVANMNLQEALRLQSMRDPLTGWFNRRYMEETLEREISRAARNRRPLAVIMFDIDRFKELNDSFGHEAGDVALQELCQTLKGQIRNEDVACRYGGDEFVLILPDTSAELAVQRAEELRAAVARMDRRDQRPSMAPMTLSLGVATFPENGRTLKALLRASDAALLRAKGEGRNKVRSYEPGLEPTAGN